jgi:hypothetical protein
VIVFVGKFLFANLFLGLLAQSYAQVSLDSRHQAALERSRLKRLTQLANINHQTATQLQNEQLTENPLRSRKRIDKPRATKTQVQGQMNAASVAPDDGGDEAMDENVARKLVRKDLPLLFMEPKTSIRRYCFRILNRKELEASVLVAITLNALCSALTTMHPGLLQQVIARHAEYVLSGIFSMELILRIVAYHPRALLQSNWNLLDAVLVLSTSIALCLTVSPPHLQPFVLPISPQLLRTARTVRAARLIQFAPAVLGALSEALPRMMTLILLCLIGFFGCASMGVSMLSHLCLLGGEATDDSNNALRCMLVNDEGKLHSHTNFRNMLMSLLTLVRFSTGDGWVEAMHRSALVSYDFPRKSDAVQRAASALNRYHNSSSPAAKVASLQEARLHLPGCIRGSEIRELQKLGEINCSAYSFGARIEVPCQGTCGTNLAKFIIPLFSIISTFLLLNLSAGRNCHKSAS